MTEKSKHILRYTLSVLACLLFTLSCDVWSTQRHQYYVKHVIDGDTVVIDDTSQSRLRYLGIDTPEILSRYSPGEPYSADATELNKRLVGNKPVTIEYDNERYDHFGRLLGYVFADGVFVNEKLVRKGLATVLIIEPNNKYEETLRAAEKKARDERLGIWGDPESFEYPPENKQFLIKPQNARRYIDQGVVTRGKITGTSGNVHVARLRMEDELDIIIFRNDMDNFSHFGIDPEEYYTGSPVEVLGRVRMFRGSPQIVISHPISIRKID